jgi:putative transposase
MLQRPLESTQYTSIAFGKRCDELGVRPSMGSVGDAYDNAVAESFFSNLECEVLDRNHFRTRAEARTAIFSWIEGWYNTHRRHSALGYLSPRDFERQFFGEDAPGIEELLPRFARQTEFRVNR